MRVNTVPRRLSWGSRSWAGKPSCGFHLPREKAPGEGVPAPVALGSLSLGAEPPRARGWRERLEPGRGSAALARGLSLRWPRAFRQPRNPQRGFWACAELARSGGAASTPAPPRRTPDSAPSWGEHRARTAEAPSGPDRSREGRRGSPKVHQLRGGRTLRARRGFSVGSSPSAPGIAAAAGTSAPRPSPGAPQTLLHFPNGKAGSSAPAPRFPWL